MPADDGRDHGKKYSHKKNEETEKCKQKMILCQFHAPYFPFRLEYGTPQYHSCPQSADCCPQTCGSTAECHCHDLVAGLGQRQQFNGVEIDQEGRNDTIDKKDNAE